MQNRRERRVIAEKRREEEFVQPESLSAILLIHSIIGEIAEFAAKLHSF
jgi:hypothetical protein